MQALDLRTEQLAKDDDLLSIRRQLPVVDCELTKRLKALAHIGVVQWLPVEALFVFCRHLTAKALRTGHKLAFDQPNAGVSSVQLLGDDDFFAIQDDIREVAQVFDFRVSDKEWCGVSASPAINFTGGSYLVIP